MFVNRFKVAFAMLLILVFGTAEVNSQIVYGELLPSDPDLDAIASGLAMVGRLGGGLAGPVVYFQQQASREFDQSMLWIHRLNADSATMAAIMTTAFLQLDRQVRSAVGSADFIIQKLEEDIAGYDNQSGNYRNPQYSPPTKAEQDHVARYKEIKRRLALLKAPAGSEEGAVGLVDAANEVKKTFDTVRARVLSGGGYVRSKVVTDSVTLGNALLEFGKVAEQAEQLAGSFMTIGSNAPIMASPMQQIKLTFTNLSSNLVFLVRLWTTEKAAAAPNSPVAKDCNRTYYLGRNTQEWIVLWPQEEKTELEGVAEGGSGSLKIQLPYTMWLPAKVKDRIEIRVATYGEHRKRIRWQNVIGRQARPDFDSMARGFYYLGYGVNEGERDQILSRWMPMSENYNWSFRSGLWVDGLGRTLRSSTLEEKKKLRNKLADKLALGNDRLLWCLPNNISSIFMDPSMSAVVSGKSEMIHATGRNPLGEKLSEKGSGELNIVMSVW